MDDNIYDSEMTFYEPFSLISTSIFNNMFKQAGAELCQAQKKLGLAKPDLSVGVLILL